MQGSGTKEDALRSQFRAGHKSFFHFVHYIFKYSFTDWQSGQYIKQCCDDLENNRFTIDVAARGHFKTTRLYAYLLYKMLYARKKNHNLYFSSTDFLAGNHISNIKELVLANRFLSEFLFDHKKSAISMLYYENPFGTLSSCHSYGALSAFRGEHTNGMLLIDDLFTEEDNKADPMRIRKVNNRFKAAILPIANPTNEVEIHVVSTPQTREDFLFDKSLHRKFKFNIRPALDDNNEPCWPERFDYDYLIEQRDEILGSHLFRQEYLCEPAYEVDAYFSENQIRSAVNRPAPKGTSSILVAGYDPAKKRHAAHFSVFEVIDYEYNGKPLYFYKQILSKFWDKVDYTDQLEWIANYCNQYDIYRVMADNTNGVLELGEEFGLLHPSIEVHSINRKEKQASIQTLDTLFTSERISLLQDERQVRHMLSVTSDLESLETKDGPGKTGHADACWSSCMAVLAKPQDLVFA